MAIDVRQTGQDELVGWLDSLTIGFLERPDTAKLAEEVRPHWDFNRVWGAFDGEHVVGTARSWATELTVPGNGVVKASAIAAVAVQPTHRRRGVLRRLIGAEHTAARERGEVASLLFASEYPIYGRFGYGVGTQTSNWIVDVSSTAFSVAAAGQSGSVAFVPVGEAAVDPMRDVFDAWRLIQPGEIWRRPIMYRYDLGLSGSSWGDAWKGFLVAHRDDAGTIDGYARYHVESKWEHRQARSTLIVDDLHGLTEEAQVGLWRFLAGVDLVTTIRAERRHPADRLPWLLTNARAAEPHEPGDGLWVKLHDIPQALEARAWERSGSVVVEAIVRDGGDDDATARRVTVALDASPDGARARETDQEPDLTVDAAALGAAYLGGTRLRHAVLAHGCDEHRSGALAEIDALFATLDPPWCSTFF